MPRPSPPSVDAEAPLAAEPTVPADRNVAVGFHGQYVPTVTAAAAWPVNAAVSKAAWWSWPLTPWPFDLESGIRVMCDVGYLLILGSTGPVFMVKVGVVIGDGERLGLGYMVYGLRFRVYV